MKLEEVHSAAKVETLCVVERKTHLRVVVRLDDHLVSRSKNSKVRHVQNLVVSIKCNRCCCQSQILSLECVQKLLADLRVTVSHRNKE